MKFKNNIYQAFTHFNINKQLSTLFLGVVIFPISILGCFILIHSNTLMQNSYIDLVQSNTLRVRSIMLDVTMHTYNLSDELASDKELLTLLSDDYETPEAGYKACNDYSHFRTIMDNNPYISSLTLYTSEKALSSNCFSFADQGTQNTSWHQKASTQASPFWESNVRKGRLGDSYWELHFYRRIPLVKTNSYAILVISISNNYLKNLIQNNTYQTVITVNQDPNFYSSIRSNTGTVFPLALNYEPLYYKSSGLMTLDHTPVIASVETLIPYRTKDKIYIASMDITALSRTQNITFSYFLILLVAIVIPTIIVHFFTKYFSCRVKTLRHAMHEVSNNNYDIMDSFSGDDELSQTFSDLKSMVTQIKQTEALIYQAQINEHKLENKQQEIEFKVLASQINPHFLYNTLETIRMKAFSEGNKEVATAIKLLGKSMRYVLSNTGTVSTTLDKELDYIKTYLMIQKLRFGERINYTIDIEENLILTEYQILPLLLQPIVENAISHGLEGSCECGNIIIRIKKIRNELLTVDIFDNGIGMDSKELQLLTENMEKHAKDSTSSIGLYNINQRIKLYYGEEYGMKIKSKKGSGTLITITIPLYNLQEDDNNECIDCR